MPHPSQENFQRIAASIRESLFDEIKHGLCFEEADQLVILAALQDVMKFRDALEYIIEIAELDHIQSERIQGMKARAELALGIKSVREILAGE